jgi:hypothetical protein
MKVLLTVAELVEVLLGILFILALPKQIAGLIISSNKAFYLGGLTATCLMIALLAYLFMLTRRKRNRLKTSS